MAARARTQLLAGVSHLHARNLVHRDLKPGNCFVARPHEEIHAMSLEVLIQTPGLCVVGDVGFAGPPSLPAPEGQIS